MTLFLQDIEIREAAFKWLDEQCFIHDNVVSRSIITNGFYFKGERITLAGPQGIWKPKSMVLPISITSVLNSHYKDSMEPLGLLHYKFRGENPFHPDNSGLREIMRLRLPLVFIQNLEKGKYFPMYPAYIQSEDRINLAFLITIDNQTPNYTSITEDSEVEYGRRTYITTTTLIRAHQQQFRIDVLRAYHNQCSLCNLKHPELLDAAHIIPDKEEMGHPVINNGIALCKIHHAAFDRNILGIDPDYTVHVRQDILQEIDGPMLKYGIQSLQGQQIFLPKKKIEHPDQERLEIRYGQFLEAG